MLLWTARCQSHQVLCPCSPLRQNLYFDPQDLAYMISPSTWGHHCHCDNRIQEHTTPGSEDKLELSVPEKHLASLGWFIQQVFMAC